MFIHFNMQKKLHISTVSTVSLSHNETTMKLTFFVSTRETTWKKWYKYVFGFSHWIEPNINACLKYLPPSTRKLCAVERRAGKTLLLWSFHMTKPTEADFLHYRILQFREDVRPHLYGFCTPAALIMGWLAAVFFSIWRMALMRFSGGGEAVTGFQSRKCDDGCSWKNTDKVMLGCKKQKSRDIVPILWQEKITGEQVNALDAVSRRPNSGSCWTEPASDIQLFSAQ